MVANAPLCTRFAISGQLFVKNSYTLLNFVAISPNLIADSMSQECRTDGRI